MTTPFPAANGHVPSADLTHTPAPDGAVQVALARLLAGHSLTSAQLQSLTLPWQLLATALMQQPDREARFAAFESALGARTDYNTLLTTIFAVDLSAPSDKIETFAQTDMGNSRRFAVQHGERLCFVAPWGWLVWDETRWQRDEKIGRASCRERV